MIGSSTLLCVILIEIGKCWPDPFKVNAIRNATERTPEIFNFLVPFRKIRLQQIHGI